MIGSRRNCSPLIQSKVLLVAKVAKTFGNASAAETLGEFRYPDLLCRNIRLAISREQIAPFTTPICALAE
jgi:hypothetical protein